MLYKAFSGFRKGHSWQSVLFKSVERCKVVLCPNHIYSIPLTDLCKVFLLTSTPTCGLKLRAYRLDSNSCKLLMLGIVKLNGYEQKRVPPNGVCLPRIVQPFSGRLNSVYWKEMCDVFRYIPRSCYMPFDIYDHWCMPKGHAPVVSLSKSHSEE